MQLQGILSIQLQGNDILVNCQGNKFIQRTYLFTKSIITRGNYIRSRNCNHFEELISSFNEIIFIQGNIFIQRKHISSYSFWEIISCQGIYSFKEHIFVQVQGHMFIQQRCVREHIKNIYSKIVPSDFMIVMVYNYYLLNKV